MPPPVLRYKGKIIWYPGIVFGKPPPELDWGTGQGLGESGRAAEDWRGEQSAGLVWTTTEKLLEDLERTDHLHGVISVLELCLSVLTEPLKLLLAALRALTRICWGFRDRVLYAVKCGVCDVVARVLHWHWSSDMGDLVLAILHIVIMLGDHGGREVRNMLGSAGVPGYLTATIKWNRLCNKNRGDIIEFACKALYQLAIGGSENRLLLRVAGADKELYCLSRHSTFLPHLQQQQVKDQAIQVLTLLKDQLISDLADAEDCWLVISSVQMAVSSMRHYDPMSPEDGKGEDLVQTGLHAIIRLASGNQLSSIESSLKGEIGWSKTTQLTFLGACELLVEVLRNFGHFRSCTTTACKSISSMLQKNEVDHQINKGRAGKKLDDTIARAGAAGPLLTSQGTRLTEGFVLSNNGSRQELGMQEERRASKSSEHTLTPTNSEEKFQCPDMQGDFQEDIDDVDQMRAIVEEQRMMLSPECLNNAEMSDISIIYAKASMPSSNFDMNMDEKSVEHNFQNGVRIVSKAADEAPVMGSPLGDSLSEMIDSTAVVLSLDVVQVDVRSRQERFQSAGVCEALVEILKITYQESMMLSDELLYQNEDIRLNQASQLDSTDSSFFKSAAASFGSLFSKSDPGAMFHAAAASPNRGAVGSAPTIQLATPRVRNGGIAGGNGGKKSFQFRTFANDMLESIYDAIRQLVKQNILARLDFYKVGLYSVLYKIRLDEALPDEDLDCTSSFQTWLNQNLVDELNIEYESPVERALCIRHALDLCVGNKKLLQCFVLLEEANSDDLITESAILISALRAISQVVVRSDKNIIYDKLFKGWNEKMFAGNSDTNGFKVLVEIVSEFRSDLEVVSQWCNAIASLASSSGDVKSMLGAAGVCSAAVGLLDVHKTRPSLVQDILWCLCSLSANNQNNLAYILHWRSDFTKGSIVSLLQTLYKSRSQTNETREHAELLLGWLDVAASVAETTSSPEAEPSVESKETVKYRSVSGKFSSQLDQVEPGKYAVLFGIEQKISWTSGEPGTLCFDGELRGTYGNTEEEVYWGVVEV